MPAVEVVEAVEVVSAPQVVEAVVEAPVAAPVAAPVVVEDIAPPAPVVPAAKPVDVEAALSDSGLVMVQTTSAAAVVTVEPPVKLGRPRKQKSVEQIAAEELVMVETQK